MNIHPTDTPEGADRDVSPQAREIIASVDGALGAAGLELTDPTVRGLVSLVADDALSDNEAVALLHQYRR